MSIPIFTASFHSAGAPDLFGFSRGGARLELRQALEGAFLFACFHVRCVQGLSENLFVVVSNSPQISAQSALWVKENIWGAEIPDAIISRLKDAKDPREEGIKICQEQIAELLTLPGIAGINLIERENADSIEAVLKSL